MNITSKRIIWMSAYKKFYQQSVVNITVHFYKKKNFAGTARKRYNQVLTTHIHEKIVQNALCLYKIP